MTRRSLAGALVVLGVILTVNICLAQEINLWNGTNYLACVNYNDGPGSSDMSLTVQLEVDGVIVAEEGSPVKYVFMRSGDSALGESLGSDWVQPGFDDSAWDDGIAGVGYSDGDDNTEVKRENDAGDRDGLAIYTRYTFNLDNVPVSGTIIIRADYDDAYAAWVNGVEIARSPNLAGSDLAWNATLGGVANHGASELPAGSPNPDRAYQEETAADYTLLASAVRPTEKLTATWGALKL